ncbi:hypothetical protein HHI36_014820 [Cryptolaemus montrouzieri]|uniref:Uncharacterized protein n=1 Tax=Cryptolaemus montrouzieri TaxID=559131 RepID=A0ABD2N4L3_9CUCU
MVEVLKISKWPIRETLSDTLFAKLLPYVEGYVGDTIEVFERDSLSSDKLSSEISKKSTESVRSSISSTTCVSECPMSSERKILDTHDEFEFKLDFLPKDTSKNFRKKKCSSNQSLQDQSANLLSELKNSCPVESSSNVLHYLESFCTISKTDYYFTISNRLDRDCTPGSKDSDVNYINEPLVPSGSEYEPSSSSSETSEDKLHLESTNISDMGKKDETTDNEEDTEENQQWVEQGIRPLRKKNSARERPTICPICFDDVMTHFTRHLFRHHKKNLFVQKILKLSP